MCWRRFSIASPTRSIRDITVSDVVVEGEDAGAARLDLLREEVGDPVGEIAALVRLSRRQEHQCGRHQREYQQERDHEPEFKKCTGCHGFGGGR